MLHWSFANGSFENKDDFLQELKSYYEDISGSKFSFKVDKIIFPASKMTVQFMKYNYEEDDWNEPQITLEADDESGFTFGELLYKIHKNIEPHLADEDNCYFEGLTFASADETDGPLYFLDTGN